MRTRPSVVLLIVSLGVVLSGLDMFVANIALPEISADLHGGDLGELSWILNAYAIVFAALLVPAGRFADRAGRKGGFLLGIVIFTAASAACATATGVPMLIGFRIVQAAGAALLVPTSLGIALAAYPPAGRAGAARVWAAAGTVAVAIAPVVAGPLVAVSWRWVFLINVPIGLIALVAGWRLLPSAEPERGPAPDVAGAALLTAAIALLALGLVNGGAWGWTSPRVLGALAAAALCAAAFFGRSARHPVPVLDTGLLRNRGFAVAAAAMLVSSVAFGGMLLSAMLWTQGAWHWSALRAGLAIAPGPAAVPFSAVLAGLLIPRIGPARVVQAGSALFAGGLLWWAAAIGTVPDYAGTMLGGTLLIGAGFGLIVPTLFGGAATALPPQRFATGAGVINMVRQIGITVGVAVLIAVIGTPDGAAARLIAFQHGWTVLAGFAILAGIAGTALPRAAADSFRRPGGSASGRDHHDDRGSMDGTVGRGTAGTRA